MGLLLVGLSHHTAPLEVRERVVYEGEEAISALRRIKEETSVPQAMLLSTCNRTELYVLGPDLPEERLVQSVFLPRFGDGGRPEWLYRRNDEPAVEHLFRVACGLDSMIVGEPQILGQMKSAYELSRRAETTGTVLHKLTSRAFRIGKRARTETKIGEGAVSVAYAAVELAGKVFGDLEGRSVLVLGAGEQGRLCAEHLLARKASPLYIANRTPEKAEALASDLGGETVPFDAIDEALTRVDIVVGTTGSPDPVVDKAMVARAMQRRSRREMIFLDTAVPRDVDRAVDSIPGVFRFDMDALQEVVDRNRAYREKEIPVVETLVKRETEMFMRWLEGLAASPVIRDLHAAFEEVREAEVARNARRFDERDREQLDVFSRNLVRKLLMGVTREIKTYRPDHPEEAERLAALRHMFHLQETMNRDEDDDDL